MQLTTQSVAEGGEAALRERAEHWRAWLFDQVLPVWADRGVNPRGGFYDRLTPEARPVDEPMRLRVQARQTYAFAEAGRLGWRGDWRRLVEHGLSFLLGPATGADGFVAPLFAPDGAVLDAAPDLYDQSFALLGYASAYQALGDGRARLAAHALLEALGPFKHPSGGYRELAPDSVLLKSNPQMHLLEAVLAWAALDDHPAWPALAAELGGLCARRLADPLSSALGEVFVNDWRPAPAPLGERTEPGHHFEWAWLLLRQGGAAGGLPERLARRGETLGVDPVRRVAVNAIDAHGAVLDPAARLWPQTERLKAALALRGLDERWTQTACDAADSLGAYTRPTGPGLWCDVMGTDGSVRLEPAPASSLYHIACAISELVQASDLRP